MRYGVHVCAMSPAEAAMLPAQSAAPVPAAPVQTLPPLARALLHAPGIVLPCGAFVRPARRQDNRKQQNGKGAVSQSQ